MVLLREELSWVGLLSQMAIAPRVVTLVPSAYAYIRIFPYEDTGVIGATKSDVLLPFRGAVSMQPYSGVMGIQSWGGRSSVQ